MDANKPGLRGHAIAFSSGVAGTVVITQLEELWQQLTAAALALAVSTLPLLNRSQRIRQRALAAVLSDPSSSGSALRAIKHVADLSRKGEPPGEIELEIQRITSFRRYPHALLLESLTNGLSVDEISVRSAAIAEQANEARRKIIRVLSGELRSLDEGTILVLYGYSSTIVEALLSARQQINHPIWVVEDLQYGDASVREHLATANQLTSAGMRPQILPFEQLVNALGSSRSEVIKDASNKTIIIPSSARFVGAIGCDAVDLDGKCLVPGVSAGRPSESRKFLELLSSTSEATKPTRLLVACETFKIVEDASTLPLDTRAPLRTPWHRKALHLFGLAS